MLFHSVIIAVTVKRINDQSNSHIPQNKTSVTERQNTATFWPNPLDVEILVYQKSPL